MSEETERSQASRRGRRRSPEGEATGSSPAEPIAADVVQPGTTGRWLVLFGEGVEAVRAGTRALTDTAGLRVASAADFGGGAIEAAVLQQDQAIVFPQLGVAVVSAPPAQLRTLSVRAAEEIGILAVEPERIVYAIDENWPIRPAVPQPGIGVAPPSVPAPSNVGIGAEYLRAFQAGVNAVVQHALGAAGIPTGLSSEIVGAAIDETQLTWGLQLTNVAASQFTGRDVRIAVLDTGLDLDHPDFAGRQIVSASFIDGESAQDGHGHGTHVIGTACGPKMPGQLPRYGIAYESEIYAGKVLSNAGSGSDAGILAGINWAITNKCAIVSMSLGAATSCFDPVQSFSRVFEQVARRALEAGTLIIAAAGNDSSRPGCIAPVSHPANCPSIIAVAAVDKDLRVASFSSGGLNPQGGQVDIAAPGVGVRSAWPRPTLYRSINGTSMATPHVAGIAALHVQANQGEMTGPSLGWLLLQSSRRLDLPARDVGAGLVQAP